MKDCCSTKDNGTSVTVNVDVTRIVRYVCIAGVIIVGIIFGTRCYHNILSKGLIDNK